MSFLNSLVPFLPLAEKVITKIIGDDPIVTSLESGVKNRMITPDQAAREIMSRVNERIMASPYQGSDLLGTSSKLAPLQDKYTGISRPFSALTQQTATNSHQAAANLRSQPQIMSDSLLNSLNNNHLGNPDLTNQMDIGQVPMTHQLADQAEQMVANPNATLKSLGSADPRQLTNQLLLSRSNDQPKLSHNQTTLITREDQMTRSALNPTPQQNYSNVSLNSSDNLNNFATPNISINSASGMSQNDQGATDGSLNTTPANTSDINSNINELNNIYAEPTRNENGILKIVADEPINSVDAGGNRTVKIVADAPTKGQLDQRRGTAGNFGSLILALKSSLVAIEQVMSNQYKVRPFTNRIDYLRDIRLSFSYSTSLYLRQEAYKCDYLLGAAFLPVARCWNDSKGVGDDKFVINHTSIIYYTDTTVINSRNAPPLLTNVTWNTLVPLMKNTSITEFSSALRIRVRGNDLDVMANAVLKSMPMFETTSGYSFATRLAKALGYVNAFMQFGRQDGNIEYSGIYRTVPEEIMFKNHNDYSVFPLSNRWINVPAVADRYIQATASINIAVTDYGSYIDNLLGRTNNWAAPFSADNLGSTTAVVYLTQAEAQNVHIVAARTLLECDYPFCFMGSRGDRISYTVNGVGAAVPIDGTETWDYPMITTAHIEGPMFNILYVLYDIENWNNNSVRYWDADINNRPSDPSHDYDLWIDTMNNFLINPNAMPTFMDEIRHWELIYGNNSDRATALRWAAENSIVFGTPSQTCVNATGAGNNLVGLKFAGSIENPFNQPGLNWWVETKDNQGLLYKTTPTYVFRNSLSAPFPYDKNKLWTKSSAFAPAYSLPKASHLIDFLVNKNWLKCAEESAQVSITDPNSLNATINDIAEVMTALADTILETESVPMTALFLARRDYPENQQNFWATLMNRRVYPQLNAILNDGIQFPNITRFAEADTRIKSFVEPWFENAFQNNWQATAINHFSISRFPFSARSKFVPQFAVTDPRVNFSLWSNKQVTYYDFFANISRTAYGVEMQDSAAFRLYASKLSLAFTGDFQKNIDYPMLVTEKSRAVEKPWVSVMSFDAFLYLQLAYAQWVAGGVPTTYLARPVGRIWPTWSVNFGGEKFYFTMLSPRSAFAKNSSTLDIRMVTETSADEPFIAAPIYSDIESPLFSFASQLNSTANFI